MSWLYRLDLQSHLSRKRMSLYELAKASGVPYQTLHRIVRRGTRSVSFDVLTRVCRALRCSPGQLFKSSTTVWTGARTPYGRRAVRGGRRG